MTQLVRICKYVRNSQLGELDKKENKCLETDGKTLHTRERCESLKKSKKGNNSSKNDEETGEYWNYNKRREVNETMNQILDSIYGNKNNSHC
jgi:hypothetical protein